MQAVGRFVRGDPGPLLDAGTAIAGACLTSFAGWGPPGLIGVIDGPVWLRLLLPVINGAALLLRRRAPLLMWPLLWAGVLVQGLVTRHPPQGWYLLFALFAGAYALGAHTDLRRSALGWPAPSRPSR